MATSRTEQGRQGHAAAEGLLGNLPSSCELSPESREERFQFEFRQYAKAHPDRIKSLADSLMQIAETEGLPRTSRTIGLREAARRIGISSGTLWEDYASHRCGAADEHGKAKFSEMDIEERKARRRKAKRPT
jgi:predicted DNA-binding protein (UPF0251 family)